MSFCFEFRLKNLTKVYFKLIGNQKPQELGGSDDHECFNRLEILKTSQPVIVSAFRRNSFFLFVYFFLGGGGLTIESESNFILLKVN